MGTRWFKVQRVGEIIYKKVGCKLNFEVAFSFLITQRKNRFIIRLPDMSPNGNPNHNILFGLRYNMKKYEWVSICLNENAMKGTPTDLSEEQRTRNNWEVWEKI
jgi:hypothetical protein